MLLGSCTTVSHFAKDIDFNFDLACYQRYVRWMFNEF